MTKYSFSRITEQAVLILLTFTVLWKGGKSLESTWLLALVACAMALWYGLHRLLRSKKTSDDPALLTDVPWHFSFLALGFVVWTAVSYVTSSTANYGLDDVLRAGSYAFVLLWTMRVLADPKRRSTFLITFSNVITVATLLACLTGFAIYIFQPVNRFVGTFFDHRFTTNYWPNAWAEFLLLTWPIIVYALREHQELKLLKILARWRTVLFGLILASLFLSYSRGALIAFCLQLIVLAVVHLRSKTSRASVSILDTIVVLFPAVCIAIAVFFGTNLLRSSFHDVQSVSEKATFTASEGTSSISERQQFWSQAFTLSLDHPLFGYGPYSFRFVQPRLATSVLATSDHPHNVFLKIAMETGYPALLLFLALLLAVLLPAIRSLQYSHDAHGMHSRALFLTAIIGVLAHNLIDYNLQFVALGLPFWIVFGALAERSGPHKENKGASFTHWSRVRMLLKVEVLLALILLLIAFWEGGQLVLSSLGRHAEAAGQPQQALRWYKSARNEHFSRDMHLSEAQLFLQLNDVPAALNAVESYLESNKGDARAFALLAVLQKRAGSAGDAILSIDRAYALGKYTDLGILELLLKSGNSQLTKKDLLSRKLEFDQLFSQYALAIEQNAHFIDLSPAPEHLMAVSRELSRLFPVDMNRYRAIARRAYIHAAAVRSVQSAKSTGLLW